MGIKCKECNQLIPLSYAQNVADKLESLEIALHSKFASPIQYMVVDDNVYKRLYRDIITTGADNVYECTVPADYVLRLRGAVIYSDKMWDSLRGGIKR